MQKRKITQLLVEFIVDLSSLTIANAVAFAVCTALNKLPSYSIDELWIYIVSLLLSFCFVFFGSSVSLDLSKRDRMREFLAVLRNSIFIYLTHSVVMFLMKSEFLNGRYLFLISFTLFVLLTSVNRYIAKRILINGFSHSDLITFAGVITVEDRAEKFISRLQQDWTKRIKGVAVIDGGESVRQSSGGTAVAAAERTAEYICGVPVVADLNSVIEWVRSEPLDEVYINVPFEYESEMASLAEEIERMGVIVHINLPALDKLVHESEFNNIECTMIAGRPMATFSAARQLSVSAALIKRTADIIGGLLGSILSLPVILLVAIPLLIESPGPLIFKQARVGKNGRVFNIYKLRSMYPDAEGRKQELIEKNQMSGFMFKIEDDPRITKVGKFIRKTSIDELPQFWNVLKGEMSLVGTRPPTIDEFSQYESRHKRRLSMRPGITGLWQVSGRSEITDFEDVVKLDCEYIDNWSVWLDLKILFKTVGVVLKGSGAK